MGGLSFGTEVTFWTVMKSDPLTAASVTSPVMSRNWYLFASMKGDAFSKPVKEFWQLGPLDETPERWKLLSPAAYLDKLTAPTLMQLQDTAYVLAPEYAVPLHRSNRP